MASPYVVHARINVDDEIIGPGEEWSSFCYPGHLSGNCFSLNKYGVATTCNRLFPDNVQRGKIREQLLYFFFHNFAKQADRL